MAHITTDSYAFRPSSTTKALLLTVALLGELQQTQAHPAASRQAKPRSWIIPGTHLTASAGLRAPAPPAAIGHGVHVARPGLVGVLGQVLLLVLLLLVMLWLLRMVLVLVLVQGRSVLRVLSHSRQPALHAKLARHLLVRLQPLGHVEGHGGWLAPGGAPLGGLKPSGPSEGCPWGKDGVLCGVVRPPLGGVLGVLPAGARVGTGVCLWGVVGSLRGSLLPLAPPSAGVCSPKDAQGGVLGEGGEAGGGHGQGSQIAGLSHPEGSHVALGCAGYERAPCGGAWISAPFSPSACRSCLRPA